MNLLLDESFDGEWRILKMYYEINFYNFKKAIAICRGWSDDEINPLLAHFDNVQQLNTGRSSWSGFDGAGEDMWRGLNENNFIDKIVDFLQEPFVYVYTRTPISISVARYLYKHRDKIKTRQENILLAGAFVRDMTEDESNTMSELMSIFGKTISATFSRDKFNKGQSSKMIYDILKTF